MCMPTEETMLRTLMVCIWHSMTPAVSQTAMYSCMHLKVWLTLYMSLYVMLAANV